MANILWEMIVKMLTHTWWCTLGGVGTFTKEVVFAGVRWVWVPLFLPPSLQGGIRRFRENRMPIFYCAGYKFLWLAHWSKGDEVRSENELVAKMLASVN